MKKPDNLVKIFLGTEANANLLKARLEEIGIGALIKNDSQSAFWGGTPPNVDLYIEEKDLKKAETLITKFIRDNKG